MTSSSKKIPEDILKENLVKSNAMLREKIKSEINQYETYLYEQKIYPLMRNTDGPYVVCTPQSAEKFFSDRKDTSITEIQQLYFKKSRSSKDDRNTALAAQYQGELKAIQNLKKAAADYKSINGFKQKFNDWQKNLGRMRNIKAWVSHLFKEKQGKYQFGNDITKLINEGKKNDKKLKKIKKQKKVTPSHRK